MLNKKHNNPFYIILKHNMYTQICTHHNIFVRITKSEQEASNYNNNNQFQRHRPQQNIILCAIIKLIQQSVAGYFT